jgi:transcription termination/antitermination protein NusA
MNKDLLAIFEYLEREKGIDRALIVKAIEEAIIVGARKGDQFMNNVNVNINPRTGQIDAFAEKEIVETVTYPNEEILFETARELDPNCQIGEWLDIEVDPKSFGRIAAAVARQVITQKIRHAEKDVIHTDYKDKMGQIVSGVVRRIARGHTVIVDLGKIEALLPARHYPKTESYHIGDRVTAQLLEVQENETGGAEVILTRSHPEFVMELFRQEVPEVQDGTIEIKKIVREAGLRTKMMVTCSDPRIDPVGSCVGVRGSRIKNIIRELQNEKIDVMPYFDSPQIILQNIFIDINVKKINIDAENNRALLVIIDEDYPIALGKKGNNARLSGQLAGLELEIKKHSEYEKEINLERAQLSFSEDPYLDLNVDKIEDVNPLIAENLKSAGFTTIREILKTKPHIIATQANISLEMAEDLLEKISAKIAAE